MEGGGAAYRLAPALALSLLGACSGVLDPAGPIGVGERQILGNSLAIMLVVVIPVIVLTFAFAWWFRAGNVRAQRLPEFAYSGRLELLVWSVPALIVVFLGGLAWVGAHELDPARPLPGSQPALDVEVVSLDWKWLFIYPREGVASVNLLVLPTGRPVHFRLTSATVMNSFFVPQLGSQIYTMAGMATTLHLQADRPGRYEGLSSHFSGDGFSGMRFEARAMPPAAFAALMTRARAAPPLDVRRYALLARESQNVRPMLFGTPQPGLFDAIVRQTAPAAMPAPAKQTPAATNPRRGS